MDAIVSVLDKTHRTRVIEIWDHLERNFGIRGIYATRFPHFSYHVTEGYDEAGIQAVLAEFAREHRPFTVRMTGLGIFTGVRPVLYIPVVRTPELTLFHQDLWLAAAGIGAGAMPLYHPHKWVPHVTLAHGDITNEMLAELVRFLSEQDLTWEFLVDNIMLVMAAGTPSERQIRLRLGRSEAKPAAAANPPG
jgi:2'-5' RNA ligase